MTRKKRRAPISKAPAPIHITPEPGRLVRLLEWGQRHPVTALLSGGAILGGILLLTKAPFLVTSARAFFLYFACAWLLGTFLLIAVITESARKYARSGGTIRAVCGAVTGAGIVALLGAPIDGVLLAVIGGALLGSTARYWMRGL